MVHLKTSGAKLLIIETVNDHCTQNGANDQLSTSKNKADDWSSPFVIESGDQSSAWKSSIMLLYFPDVKTIPFKKKTIL